MARKLHTCTDCDDGYKKGGLWRTNSKCDECGGSGEDETGDTCVNCGGYGEPVCCRCEGTGVDPE